MNRAYFDTPKERLPPLDTTTALLRKQPLVHTHAFADGVAKPRHTWNTTATLDTSQPQTAKSLTPGLGTSTPTPSTSSTLVTPWTRS
ncbi:hypothetical protein BGZ54_004961, partial [Gamsiella multidivaricata]